LTGRPPFQAASTLETLKLVLEQDPVPLRALNSQVQRDLETICMKCLEKDPAHRYPTAAALAGDLGAVLRGEAISVRGSDLFEQLFRLLKRNRDDFELRAWGLILQGFAVIVLATEVWVWFVSQMDEPRRTALMLAGRACELIAMGLVCWWQRRAFQGGKTAATRQMWTHWIAFLVACHCIAGVIIIFLWRLEPSNRFSILMAYPYFSIVSGMTWFTLGSNFWGYCYLIGAAFFALSLVMPFLLAWSPLLFGLLWATTLWITAIRLKQMSVE
jgi:serine/threonine-protein kinase